MPPSSKIISRQDFPPQLQGLADMYLAYNIAAGQIRHRPGYLHDAVIGTGRQIPLLKGRFHQLLSPIRQLAIFFQYAVIHLGITDNIQLPEPVQLDFSGCHHPLADDGGFFRPDLRGYLLVGHPGHPDLNIKPVQKRARQLPSVLLDLRQAALAGNLAIPIVAAGAGIYYNRTLIRCNFAPTYAPTIKCYPLRLNPIFYAQ